MQNIINFINYAGVALDGARLFLFWPMGELFSLERDYASVKS